jgi:hypothetical protein
MHLFLGNNEAVVNLTVTFDMQRKDKHDVIPTYAITYMEKANSKLQIKLFIVEWYKILSLESRTARVIISTLAVFAWIKLLEHN